LRFERCELGRVGAIQPFARNQQIPSAGDRVLRMNRTCFKQQSQDKWLDGRSWAGDASRQRRNIVRGQNSAIAYSDDDRRPLVPCERAMY